MSFLRNTGWYFGWKVMPELKRFITTLVKRDLLENTSYKKVIATIDESFRPYQKSYGIRFNPRG